MRKNFLYFFYTLVFAGLALITVSCGDDDPEDTTPAFSFPGTYALTSAQTASGSDILLELGALLLADAPCDTSVANNPSLIQLEAGADNNSGNVNIVCAAEPGVSQQQGTWSYNQATQIYSLTLNVTTVVGGVPITTPVPLNFQDLTIAVDDDGTVLSIVGTLDLSAFASQLPVLSELVTLTFLRV